jgi:hypothetical protein
MDEPMTVRRFVWLIGWIVVALIVLTLLLVLFNALSGTNASPGDLTRLVRVLTLGVLRPYLRDAVRPMVVREDTSGGAGHGASTEAGGEERCGRSSPVSDM